MSEFIRPAARAHWFDREDDCWGTSAPEELLLVSPHPEASLVPHPSCSSWPDPFEPASSPPNWYAITESYEGGDKNGIARTD